ncbi:MAG TPA: twin-arginine translocase TatA/TatE family subunit [Solirubrobacteraceae bacterium]|nr:twin-arginine translocase TatA/TatE family subunit [Solirubrobacteraceae bacterium]
MGLDNPLHIAFLVVILLLVFGARRLPEIGRSLGSGMREFKQSVTGEDDKPSLPVAAQQPQQPVGQPAQAPMTTPPAEQVPATAPPAQAQAPSESQQQP